MDWGMTFASIYTLVAISIDRYWAACYSLHYRRHNTKKRTIVIIVMIWYATFNLFPVHVSGGEKGLISRSLHVCYEVFATNTILTMLIFNTRLTILIFFSIWERISILYSDISIF